MQSAEYMAKQSDCPRRGCGAKAGESCRDRSGNAKLRMHAARYRAVGTVPERGTDERRKESWFKTFAQHPSQCHGCDCVLRRGDVIAYRKRGSVVLCAHCVSLRCLSPKPSQRWQAQQAAA